MERIGALIQRMLEQYNSNADRNSLILTAQMLLNELQENNNGSSVGGKKVTVILPSIKKVEISEQVIKQQEDNFEKNFSPENIEESIFDEEAVSSVIEKSLPTEKKFRYNIEDIPTFAYQQKDAKELNDAMAQDAESLNDKLKTEKKELGSLLKESPVRDLRKAIGINDRFVFINELFRGDENMYERSIKTINSFNALPEAEFWIQRELKTKIGWGDSSETVHHFDQLVRRRFS
jgi:hypothetical protein